MTGTLFNLKRGTCPSVCDYRLTQEEYAVARLVGEPELRTQLEGDLGEDWSDVVNVLRQYSKKPTAEKQRRIVKIVKTAIEDMV